MRRLRPRGAGHKGNAGRRPGEPALMAKVTDRWWVYEELVELINRHLSTGQMP
jgi:hypothetical protein